MSAAFLDACDRGDADAVRKTLRRCSTNAEAQRLCLSTGRFGRGVLFLAARFGSVDVARALLDAGAGLEQKNDHGFTPLYTAALFDRRELIALLVSKGASLEAVDLGGLTPLHIASEKGHAASVQQLLDCGADREAKDSIGRTPLDWAIAKERTAVVALLASP